MRKAWITSSCAGSYASVFYACVSPSYVFYVSFRSAYPVFKKICLLNPYVVFNLVYKGLGRFKGRNIMGGNNQGGIL